MIIWKPYPTGKMYHVPPNRIAGKERNMEQGGIFAQPSIRGGSEYGEEWHKGGMLQNKQSVFDDFIAAAEYLINEKYTNKDRIAIRGGSNDGLLVGAVMTQRPDLFKVALPQVGVMDMLRYHKFTIGLSNSAAVTNRRISLISINILLCII